MKLKVCCAGALLLVSSFGVFADDQPKKSEPKMDPAMMEMMMKAGAPGDAQKKLDAMIGTWDTAASMWMMPGMDPMKSTGVSVNQWVMGGRYMEQRYTGNVMGMPFEGLGFTGYDNVKKQYWGTWMDNMSTGVMTSAGSMTDEKTFQFKATMADPMSGKDTVMDEKVTIIDADHHRFETWAPGPDGKMFRTMEITYSRRK